LDLSYMADSMVKKTIDIGDTLSLGNELANSFIIVVTGNLSYYQEDEVKTNIKAGEFIGELVLNDKALESAMVVANQNTELYIIDKDLWHDLLADNITFAQSVFSNLTA